MNRTVIIGDIHGCFDELLELLEKVDLRPDDLLVSVGDVVDRGPAPGEVVTFFRERPNSVVVMGNHERKHVRGIFSFSQEITRLQLGERYPETVEWMRTLPYYFENEHVRVVHAAVVSGVPLADQKEEILCGSTSGERELTALFPDSHWYDHYADAKPVVFGHHVTGREPMIRDGRIFGLDTGACHGWNLTALCVPGFTVHSVEAHADHWSITKRQWQLPVLKTKPWHDFTWSQLAAAAARVSPASDAATRSWLEAVEKWAADLRSSFPALVEAAHRLADELSANELRQHPAAPYLFQARDGRLDQTSLERQCPTPRRTIDLAAALGLVVPKMPD
ncbi:Bis(5'-nucleosyl)-tetraphosphatase, symmetrical [Nonomuraea coxensis DSM 45129]|uniref:Bis(5'-nucleosyl)-tetraphosphatase, symmetrical n=1 Tax=Nonomuraea coxensis DSM 45129 TaxID=1122611 RepID=A0ABX8U506_9ACTN|nr:metallophosphoesterase family protein [Nonomuraea coxensis]QYC41728.1 Bis(5'-nucleosyl)-tetraphosphatase, symmetrical [Nonomuraea coxensis DSM 45129]